MTGVTLSLYEAECDDNPQECPIADLGCPSRGEFKASVYGLKAKEAGTWLATDEKSVSDPRPTYTAQDATDRELRHEWGLDVYLSQFDDATRICAVASRNQGHSHYSWESKCDVPASGCDARCFPRVVERLRSCLSALQVPPSNSIPKPVRQRRSLRLPAATAATTFAAL